MYLQIELTDDYKCEPVIVSKYGGPCFIIIQGSAVSIEFVEAVVGYDKKFVQKSDCKEVQKGSAHWIIYLSAQVV